MAEFPVADLDGVTELRIHGVSGTPVTSMLQHPHPVQVSGDASAGFYRRGSAEEPEEPERKQRRLEAYSWGRLTAGASGRALWLLLLPFALINVASWAHPVRPKSRFTPVGSMSGIIRALALSATGTMVVGAAVLGIDVYAWQCGGDNAGCASHHAVTAFLGEGYWHEPGRRLAVGALLPILVVLLLWWLARTTGRNYEEYAAHIKDGTGETALAEVTAPGAKDLAQPRFWDGGKPLSRLRGLHTGGALALVAALVSYPAYRGGARGTYHLLGTWLLVLSWLVVGLALVLAVTPYTGRRRQLFEHKEPPYAAVLLTYVVGYGGVLLAVAAEAYAMGWTGDRPTGPLPGLTRVVDAMVWFQVTGWALLLLGTGWSLLASRETWTQSLRRRPMFLGFAAPALVALGIVVAGAYVSGVGLRVADYLGTPSATGVAAAATPTATLLRVPAAYYWAGTGFAIAAITMVPTLLVTLVVAWRAARRQRQRVRTEYAVATGDDDRVRTIAKAEVIAGLTDTADAIVAPVVLAGIVGAVGLWVATDGVLSPLATFGTWLVGAFALGIVGLGRSAYRNETKRRTVGIIWDLATFWPRAAHPYAPPCYCERTVPELRRRVGRLRDADGTVVLSAHSQGSVIATATLLQLPPADRARVGLVTYGCPVDRLYARAFPHFFGQAVLADVERLQTHPRGVAWDNMYRLTDPIGGPVRTADSAPADRGIDHRFVDPSFHKETYEFTWPRSRGHSDYPHDPRFEQLVTAVVDVLAAPDAISLTDPERATQTDNSVG